jgi:hypothetical protein
MVTEDDGTIPAFPLAWPAGWSRTGWPHESRYRVTFARARDDLVEELSKLGAKSIVISTNIPLKRDGFPYANFREPEDRGVAVYFDLEGQTQVIACDKWNRVGDNLRACGYAVGSLRQLERCGASEILERAFTGFRALPAGPSCWSVLQIEPTTDHAAITSAFKRRALQCHPDVDGGSQSAFQALQSAYEEAQRHARTG